MQQRFIVDCRGEVQLGGPDPWYNRGGPAKVGARDSFVFTESSLEVTIKNNLVDFVVTLKFCVNTLHCRQYAFAYSFRTPSLKPIRKTDREPS